MNADPGAGVALIEDEIVPVAEARLPILDWGFLHSDATYDVAHVWQGRFFRLEEHLDRFFAGMDALRMYIPHDREAVSNRLHDLVAASGLRDAYVEMICTRGQPRAGSRDPRTCTNRFLAFAVPFVWIADPAKQETGLHLTISRMQRIPPASVDPTVKNYHWLDMVQALFEAYDRGAETAITVDAEDNVVEGPGFNLFVVQGGDLATPATGVLPGVTRRTVIELGDAHGRGVQAQSVRADTVRGADEVFITSTAGGVMPVTRVDGALIGDGKPGPVTRALRDAYWRLHEEPWYTQAVSYERAAGVRHGD
ncbi:aminotransferase class IV [Halofilum ochraceum]|uniref:aminotransferase class IV n=1 Tax=Halofilum ochraceum TaxID=1611323 RepID=UPI00082EA85F|nr:aminotransferase class IV [Halofilum ochraceum]